MVVHQGSVAVGLAAAAPYACAVGAAVAATLARSLPRALDLSGTLFTLHEFVCPDDASASVSGYSHVSGSSGGDYEHHCAALAAARRDGLGVRVPAAAERGERGLDLRGARGVAGCSGGCRRRPQRT